MRVRVSLWAGEEMAEAQWYDMSLTKEDQSRRDGCKIEHLAPISAWQDDVHDKGTQDTKADDELVHAAQCPAFV